MNKSNENQYFPSSDSAWYLLIESSLVELISEIDLGDGLKPRMFQKMKELEIPPQCVEKVEMTLTSFAREVLAHDKQAGLELPGLIRVFCQIKLIDGLITAKTSEFNHSGQNMEQIQMIHHPSTRMDGGWGYFLIERGGNIFADSPLSPYRVVDLYLYKEG